LAKRYFVPYRGSAERLSLGEARLVPDVRWFFDDEAAERPDAADGAGELERRR